MTYSKTPISWGNHCDGKLRPTNGFGYATDRIWNSLDRIGYDVRINDPNAKVQIYFDQPHHYKWNFNQYKIAYFPWESTELPDQWRATMNEADEVWTPSPIIAEWLKDDGIYKPVHVFEHGIDNIWSPGPKKESNHLVFLHVGGEALRKGLTETMKAFRLAFQNNNDVGLILKMNDPSMKISSFGKVQVINGIMPIEKLVKLHHDCHAFVYPSWGEGFGLSPLQAMATGMPTICTGAWAPYEQFLDEDLTVDSELVRSPWQKPHPGNMFKPDLDDLIDKYRFVYDNYDLVAKRAEARVPDIKKHYNWDVLTASAFGKLEKRLENSSNSLAL